MTDVIKWADISEFQPEVDWAAYGAHYPAVCIRAYNGSRPDNYWNAHRDGARAHVKYPGWYLYLQRGRDAAQQAHEFVSLVGSLRGNEWAMLDAEMMDFRYDGTDRQRAEDALRVMKSAWPRNPVTVYSEGSSFGGALAGVNASYPKIIASVLTGTSDDAPPSLEPRLAHAGWQFSWAHSFVGIGACDGNRFYGTTEQWKHAMGWPGVTRPIPSPVPLPPKGHAAYKKGDGGHGALGVGVAALQNALRELTGANLHPSNPPWFGEHTELALYNFQVFFKLIPHNHKVDGTSAGEKTIHLINALLDQRR